MKNKVGLTGTLDLCKLTARLKKVDDNAEIIDKLVADVVNRYCSELDEFISNIYKIISNKEVDVPDVDIEYMVLQLPMLMYFASSNLEDLGVREDVSRAFEREVYNAALMETEGTVAVKESAAQLASQQEALVTMIAERSYRKIKSRLEYASETLGSLKKVIANRIADKELSVRGNKQ